MKINQEIRDAQKQAVRLYKEAERALARVNKQVREEENFVIQRMFNEVFYSDKPLSAKEISARLNGDMSWQEVSGQMVVAAHPQHQEIPTHQPTRDAKMREAIHREYRTKTRRFVETDEYGLPVPGGDVIIRRTTNVVYSKAK